MTEDAEELRAYKLAVTHLDSKGAGDAVNSICGSTNWHSSLTGVGSQAFVKSFDSEYGFPLSKAAYTCYTQTLLYADACERAGTY